MFYLKGNFITTQSVLVKKECFDKVGMFDERLPRLQDWEMWIRISKHYGFKFIDKPLVLASTKRTVFLVIKMHRFEALKTIVEKHFDEFCMDKKILSFYYSLIGNELYFCKNKGWSKYYLKSIKLSPLDVKRIISIVIALFGQKTYKKIQIQYSKTRIIVEVCLIFCKIINLKKLVEEEFQIMRAKFYTVGKNLALNLQ